MCNFSAFQVSVLYTYRISQKTKHTSKMSSTCLAYILLLVYKQSMINIIMNIFYVTIQPENRYKCLEKLIYGWRNNFSIVHHALCLGLHIYVAIQRKFHLPFCINCLFTITNNCSNVSCDSLAIENNNPTLTMCGCILFLRWKLSTKAPKAPVNHKCLN